VEGRDTTTVVFPRAWKKFYLDASLEERAKRRYLQYKGRGMHLSMEECMKDVLARDKRDSSRDIAPLKKADDSFVVDSSNLSIEEVQEKMIEHIRAEP
jgi:cytidylate kinase